MIRISQHKIDMILNLLITTDRTTTDIGKEIGCSHGTVYRELKNVFTTEEIKQRLSRIRSRNTIGNNNPMYGKRKDSKRLDTEGYVRMPKPLWYTGRPACRDVYEHHVVICKELGITGIPKGHCVHHVDEDKANNTLTNLMLMTFSTHTALHRKLRREYAPEL